MNSSSVIKLIASDLAPELEQRLNDWLKSDMLPGSQEHSALTLFLWDNKIGMLSVLQSRAVKR